MAARIRPFVAPAHRLAAAACAGESRTEPPLISSGRLAILILIAGETMVFAGLIGALLVYKGEAPFWPPPGLPRLPLFVSSVNTLVLLASAATMCLAVRAVHQNRQRVLRRRLLVTGALGLAFLAVQGNEWVRLVAHGLRLSSGTYGATFYTLVGFHGAHVTAAAIWLAVVAVLALRGRYNAHNAAGVELCAMYWTFVCMVWPILFVLVYLA